MTTKRLFTLFVVFALTAVVLFSVQSALANAGRTYHESSLQIVREYQLGERYGETPQNPGGSGAGQNLREYILGERYGVTPQDAARNQAAREYWLGERYGVTP